MAHVLGGRRCRRSERQDKRGDALAVHRAACLVVAERDGLPGLARGPFAAGVLGRVPPQAMERHEGRAQAEGGEAKAERVPREGVAQGGRVEEETEGLEGRGGARGRRRGHRH